MTMLSVRRRATRAAALVASGLLALGLAQAPTSAESDRGPAARPVSAPERDLGLTWSEVRDLAASARADLGNAGRIGERGAPRRTAVVSDPRGDAERLGALGRPRPHTLLADLTRVFYRTASRADGDLRIGATWAEAVDAGRSGVRRQYLVTFIFSRSFDGAWVMWVGNAEDRVVIFRLEEGRERRVRPERVSVRRSFGHGGSTRVVLSDEWLDARRISTGSIGISGWDGEASDETETVRRPLLVGPVR